MCLAVPAKVIRIDGENCIAEILGVSREVSLELLKNVRPGDYVLVHAGCAIQIVDEEEALKTLEIFRELKELEHE